MTMRPSPGRPAGIASFQVSRADPSALQDFLAKRLSVSRRAAKAMVDGRSVWVNRTCAWMAGFRLRPGDVVEVPRHALKPARSAGGGEERVRPAPAGKRHVRVLWQNERYLVCDKPSGRLACDDPKSVEALLREQESLPALTAVHRLDRDTTGCMLFAKSAAALQAAIGMFRTHRVEKTYHTVVAGRFPYLHQTIDAPIGGDPAVSRVTREAASADASLLRIRIETGRTNQIRRHLASIRFPVVGDRVFGLKSARDPRLMQVPRQMLHASTLELPDPGDPRGTIRVHSPLPADFRATLRLFGLGRR